MINLNSEAYNKNINTKDGIDADSYLLYLKQEDIDARNSLLNFNSDKINSWSSIKADSKSWLDILKEVERRNLFGKLNKS
jgi:hypothetical protein